MRERQILMHAQSVRGILEGRKTQTRRVVKPQPSPKNDAAVNRKLAHMFLDCPYGEPGDRLWVRETHAFAKSRTTRPNMVWYRADGEHQPGTQLPLSYVEREDRWRPSIHMPRWASRITLEVTEVRVERVQEISVGDVEAEGVELTYCCDGFGGSAVPSCGCRGAPLDDPIRTFAALWDETNAHRLAEYGWAANPWVWVVSFRRIEP